MWQREEEAAVLNNVMAEDYASLLKSVQKSTFTRLFFFFTRDEGSRSASEFLVRKLASVCVIFWIFIPTASKKKGGTKSSSDEENIPSSSRKVTCDGAKMTGGQPPLARWPDAVWCLGENDEETTTFIETGEGVGQQAEHLRQTVRTSRFFTFSTHPLFFIHVVHVWVI